MPNWRRLDRVVKRVLPLALCALAATLVTAPFAQARGFADITCQHSHYAQVDPILKYSTTVPPDPSAVSGHMHEFFCNESVNSNSTVESLKNASSTARVQSDINGFWMPAAIGPFGDLIPGSVEYRIVNQTPPNGAPVIVPPEGLDFIRRQPRAHGTP